MRDLRVPMWVGGAQGDHAFLEVRRKGGTVKSRSRDTERKGVRCTRQVGGEQWLGTKQGDEIYSLVKQEEVTKASFHNETG